MYESYRKGEPNPLKPLPVQYADFALWQRDWLESSTLSEGLRYWKEQLSGIPAQLELPTDHPRPPLQTFKADICYATVPAELTKALKRISQEHNATLYMVLLSAFAVLLSRYSGQDDVVIGSPIANRQDPQLEDMIGFFVNMLVLRIHTSAGITFGELIKQVRETALGAYHYQDVPFEKLVDELSPERNMKASPIFQVSFALQNAPRAAREVAGLNIHTVSAQDRRVRFDLELHAFETEREIHLHWLHNKELFDSWRVEQMARHYVCLLQAFISIGNSPCDNVDWLDAGEKRKILGEWNDTHRPVPHSTLPRLFEKQAIETPDSTAVIWQQHALTYRELNQRSNRLAHYLIAQGVGPEDIVAVYLERSPEMVIAILGILKAGAAYLPLKTDYPMERVQLIFDDARPAFAISTTDLASNLPGIPTVALDAPQWAEALAQMPAIDPARGEGSRPDPTHPAYVIYTSGSTGTPKGVIVSHEAIVNHMLWMDYANHLGPSDRVLQKTPFVFDASVWEFCAPLLAGACLVMAPSEVERDPHALAKTIREQGITVLQLVPSLLSELLHEPSFASCSHLKHVFCGGETLPPNLIKGFFEVSSAELYNLYGPTEATIDATWMRCERRQAANEETSIGAPVWNTTLYVLDQNLAAVPVGVRGELYIAGLGLARGYLNRPGLTADRFMPNPFGPSGSRMYRSGDIVRWRPDGNLEFSGRADSQIKLRGVRIELGEIEAALRSDSRVQDAVVVARNDGSQGMCIVAYVTRTHAEADRLAMQSSQLDEWRQVHEDTYRHRPRLAGDFDISGWNSSYTLAPIPSEEMRLWVEETVERLSATKPRKVLDIGCGTGLLLTRLAAETEEYVGIDYSAHVIEQLKDYLSGRPELRHVELRQGLAHNLEFIEDASVDLVILNSVVQYFPDLEYLIKVLAQAIRVTKEGGNIFVGDIRSLPLLDAYHTSVQLHRASEDLSVPELRHRIRQAQQKEGELVLHPDLFRELGRRLPKMRRTRFSLKSGAYDNELSRFRYDVMMSIGGIREELAEPARWIPWGKDGSWREQLDQVAGEHPGTTVGIRAIRDLRVAPALEARRLLQSVTGPASQISDIARASMQVHAEDPHQVFLKARTLDMDMCWQPGSDTGVYDVIFNPAWRECRREADVSAVYYRAYANSPAANTRNVNLGAVLQEELRKVIPAYMMPATVMVLQSWPLTPSGKVDRKALPAPDYAMTAEYRAPKTPREEILCSLYAEVLGVERVGLDDNFFELGGDSLISIRLVARIRRTLDIDLPVRSIFEVRTVGELASLLDADRTQRVSLVRRDRPAVVSLSYAQERLWFLDQLGGGQSTEFNAPMALRLSGELDVCALEQTINAIVERHESLRTHFREVEGKPEQVIESELRIAIPIEDLRGLEADKQEERVREVMEQEAQRAFDLSRGPLLRVKVLKLGEQEHILLRTMHHIVSDGWSQGVFNREFKILYESYRKGEPNPLKPLPVQYADFALWQRDWLESSTLSEGLRYWKEQLSGIPAQLELPTDHPRPPLQTFKADICYATVPAELTKALKRISQEHNATLYMVLLSAFAVLLSRYSGQDDVVIGSPIANRQDPQLEDMIGFFVNTLVLRIRLDAAMSFSDLFQQVRETALDAYRYQDVPYERLVEEVLPTRRLDQTPIFQVLFALQNTPTSASRFEELEITPLRAGEPRVRYDLEANAWEREGSIALSWLYNRDLFDRWRVEQMLRHYLRLLQMIVENVSRPFTQADPLSVQEKRCLLIDRNNTECNYPYNQSIHEMFERRAELNPEVPAVILGGASLSYLDLNTRANRLARFLREFGISSETRVGICIEHGFDMIVAVMAILKAGGAYVPFDPTYPVERLAYMLDDSQAPVLITQQSLRDRLPVHWAQVICLDSDWPQIEQHNGDNLSSNAKPENLAYVIYTSGSTGRPKGVMVQHRALVNYVFWASRAYDVDAGNGTILHSSLGFDLTVTSLFPSLIEGKPIHLVVGDSLEGLAASFAEAQDLSLVKITPSHLATLFQQLGGENTAGHTRAFVVGGEALTMEHVTPWLSASPVRILNEYGPTETVVGCCLFDVGKPGPGAGALPIGRPISNASVYVLDAHDQLCPVGVWGELYVGGAGVSRGYLNRPGLTAERFVPDGYAGGGGRLYRTGDRVRWNERGELEYQGRVDEQVKVRGYRIEPGEIEAVLQEYPGVLQSAVIAREDTAGDKRLVGYVVWSEGEPAGGVKELRSHVQRRLPEYMVPSAFVSLASLPLTGNGKLDRKALTRPEEVDRLEMRVDPRDNIELQLKALWESILDRQNIDISQNFFDLGGNSLTAVSVATRTTHLFAMPISVRQIFATPTIQGIAGFIRANGKLTTTSTLVPINPRGIEEPLFLVHPLSGMATCYLPLSRSLGNRRPLYAFQSYGLGLDEPPFHSIEEMSERYIADMKRLKDRGPYLLGGWSFGALIAYEMGQQLSRLGDEVGCLFILDTVPRVGRKDASGSAYLDDYLRHRLADAGQLDLTADVDLRSLYLTHLKQAGLYPPDAPAALYDRFLNIVAANKHAAETYCMNKYLGGRAVVLRSNDSADDDFHRWADMIEDVSIHACDSTHADFVSGPNAETLARFVTQFLQPGYESAVNLVG